MSFWISTNSTHEQKSLNKYGVRTGEIFYLKQKKEKEKKKRRLRRGNKSIFPPKLQVKNSGNKEPM